MGSSAGTFRAGDLGSSDLPLLGNPGGPARPQVRPELLAWVSAGAMRGGRNGFHSSRPRAPTEPSAAGLSLQRAAQRWAGLGAPGGW